MTNNAETVKRTGPMAKTTLHCHGCSALVTKDWSFEEENDGVDSGTDARCSIAERHIASYWHSSDKAPNWCPATDAALALAGERE